MAVMPVDRSDARPLHAQVADVLRAQIRDHSIAPGETLPSEAALRERFGVSRSVVRQALATLEDEGAVRRAHGRAPVAAVRSEHHRLVQRVTGLFDQFSAEGLSLSTRVVALDPVRAGVPSAEEHLGTRTLLRLERVRSVAGDPLSYVRTWLPAERFAGLEASMLSDASLHRLMESRFGVVPTSGRRQIRAVPADPEIARELDVPEGAPLLLLEGGTFDRSGAPLEWFESWHRSDRVVFDIEAEGATDQVQIAPGPSLARPEGDHPSGEVQDTELDRALSLADELRSELRRLRG
ncbi:GntR family transcriptional regulator [Nocardiopsis sp. MG754419]|uniref:GntR family transcriptional regulator n=1 Tax=Nocardiopsis sp. MG754419 TaxID=2259865 RepID=UPI001BACEF62|nr:GntR family transcriptional regulator [Nocardiopsis sp. MG754419]MBR8744673.1 GntR family transcriptional regulator [Nocardiopsis sp. MG754419]